jgi:hypothetical protein
LLLILPLQSTLAAIDSCCSGVAEQQRMLDARAVADHIGEPANLPAAEEESNCCTLCDFCNHASLSFDASPTWLRGNVLTAPPVPHPDLPIDSFIPDVPYPPDWA